MIATATQRNDYVGNGATATYAYGWKVFAATDLRILKRDLAGAVTVLAYLTDFTATGIGDDAGGSITLVAGFLPTGYTLTIRRARPLLQQTDVRNQGQFFAGIHEDAFDRAEMDAQYLKDEVSRAIKLPEDEPRDPNPAIAEAQLALKTILPRAADRASKVLGFDASGNVIALTTIPTGATVITAYAATLLAAASAAAARAVLGGICPRVIAAGSGIAVANGDGVAGDPTVSASGISRAHMAADTRTIHYAAAAPAAPADGQFWWDTTTSILKRYRLSDTSWREYLASDEIAAVSAAIPDQWLTGLSLVYVSGTQIQIAAGAAVDAGGAAMIRLTSAQTVDITVTGANGRDAGAAVNGWWYVWLIRNPTSGGVAGLVSLSATAPTMPAGYTQKRWIGALRYTGGWNVFYTTGEGRDKTLNWQTHVPLSAGVNIIPAASAFSTTAGIPPDARCRWGLFQASAYNPPGGAPVSLYFIRHNNGGGQQHEFLMDDPPNLAMTHKQINSSSWEMALSSTDTLWVWTTSLSSGGCVYYLGIEGFRYKP
jgi:hypothetical protein